MLKSIKEYFMVFLIVQAGMAAILLLMAVIFGTPLLVLYWLGFPNEPSSAPYYIAGLIFMLGLFISFVAFMEGKDKPEHKDGKYVKYFEIEK